jgi:hypothetical protein
MREGGLSERHVENSEEKELRALKWKGTLKIRKKKYNSRLRGVNFYISWFVFYKVFFFYDYND